MKKRLKNWDTFGKHNYIIERANNFKNKTILVNVERLILLKKNAGITGSRYI